MAWREFYDHNLRTKTLSDTEFKEVNKIRKWMKKPLLDSPNFNENSKQIIDRGEELIGLSFYQKCDKQIKEILK